MNSYQELKIWNKAMDLVEKVYWLLPLLPDEEKFGLIAQMKRCAVSISSNIAEGAGRNHNKEFKHFLSISNGSTTELETQLLLIDRLGFVKSVKTEDLLSLCNEIKKMNYALQKSLT